MRLSAVAALVVGMAIAGAAVFFAAQKIESARLAAEAAAAREPTTVTVSAPPPPTTSVVVAARAIAAGDKVSLDALTVADWPEDLAPSGVFHAVEAIEQRERPHRALHAIAAGEPILPSKLSGYSRRGTISGRLSPGKRAVSIRVDDVSGVAGFLLPGDRVDVLLTRETRERDVATGVILQNIAVIGVDQMTDTSVDRPRLARTVTVEAKPAEAQKLALAMQVGSLSLALRQSEEHAAARTRVMSVDDLGVGPSSGAAVVVPAPTPAAAPAPQIAERPVLRIRRGATVSEEPVMLLDRAE